MKIFYAGVSELNIHYISMSNMSNILHRTRKLLCYVLMLYLNISKYFLNRMVIDVI